MAPASSQQQQLSEFLGEFKFPEFSEGSSTEQETSVSEKKWAPGFIQLTRKAAGKISVQLDSVIIYEGMNRTGGTTIRVREFPDWIQVEESLEEISDLIRDNWERRVSGEAAYAAEYGSGDYKIGKDGWK